MKGVALLGAVLHFGFDECLDMDISEFLFFIDEAKEAIKE